MSVELPDQNVFKEMEKFDEMQILKPELRDKLAYKIKVRGKERLELSYAGIKQLILEMSQKEQSMEIVSSKIERIKIDENTDNWYAEVTLRNKKTGHEAWGVSENPVYFNGEYDQFGRTKAVSKAIRNAERQQLPELLISSFLENSQKADKVQEIQTDESLKKGTLDKICNCDDPRFGENSRICLTCGGYDAN